MAEESRPVSYYRDLSAKDLEAEIAREEELLAGLRDQLTEATEKRDETREAIKKERLLTVEERIKAREAEIRVLETRLAEREQTIGELERQLRVLKRELFGRPPIIVFLERRISAYRGWQTRDRRMLRTLRGWLTREEKALDRFAELRRELLEWISEIDSLKGQITLVEEEIDKKREALVRYNLVEYTKYFEVIVVNRKKTPPIRVELRGEFTIPGYLALDDPRVLAVIETKFRQAFVDWGKYWMGPFSDIAKAGKETQHPEWRWQWRDVPEGRGWFAEVQSVFLEHWREGEITYGLEAIAKVDKFISDVDVLIAKYKDERLDGTWTRRVTVGEEEFPSEEEG